MVVMLLEWVFTSIFLILVVLALRAALGKRMSAGLRYALWGVVLARLLVPVQLFTSPLAGTWVFAESRVEQNIYKVTGDGLEKGGPDDILAIGRPDGPTVVLQTGPVPSVPDAPTVPDAPEPPAAPDLTRAPVWLGWLWLAGGAAVAFTLLLSNLRFSWHLRRCRIRLEDADCPLPVYVAVGLPSPCLFGVVRPAVYVTPEAAADPDMLRHVLAHELTHCRHGDHIWSLLRCAALAVHWWNPLVWWCAVLSRRDGELACDEGALKRLGDGERAAYGNTLLALVTAKPRPGDLLCFATTMAGEKESLKERIGRIAHAPRRALWAAVAAVLAVSLACLCAFGQGLEETPDEPDPSPAPSAEPAAGQGIPEVEIAFTHAGIDLTSSFAVPEDVLDAVRTWVGEQFAWDAPGGVMVEKWGVWNPETEQWEERQNPDGKAYFDRVRVNYMNGPWVYSPKGTDYEIWRVNYEYHTTTPETAENLIVGGMYLTEDGWLCPTYPNCTYLIFTRDGGELRLAASTLINDCSPDSTEDASYRFYGDIYSALFPEDPLTGYLMRRTFDLNHNGAWETMHLVELDGGMGKRLELREGDEVIWYEEGFSAHAGWTSIFECYYDGQYCLLRYLPTMYGGSCAYSYQLFTLEGGKETVIRENSVEFDINFQPWIHQSFDPDAIAAFMDEINGLLESSVQVLNTDQNLLDTFQREGRLYDSLWWLGMWEDSGFVYDEGKSLADNLRDYQEAVERTWYAEEPELRSVDDNYPRKRMRLCYRDKVAYFDGLWDEDYQPESELHVLDLNGDGKDEILFSLIDGRGTGVCVENLYAFDAETLEQYDTSGLNNMVLASITSTGDGENFYLETPGMDRVTIPRSMAKEGNEFAPVADALCFGDIVRYTVRDTATERDVHCLLGLDASGLDINYIGWLEVVLHFTGSGFQCGPAQYTGGAMW